mgnify:CR=1 FL=1
MSVGACASLVERGDPDKFMAIMAAPIGVRGKLFVLYAFNLEVARAPWVTKEPMIAEMRLQWWRDVVVGTSPLAHEVAGPLHDLIREAGLPVEVLDKLVTARIWDIYSDPFADYSAFSDYIDDTSAGLMWLAAKALGADAHAETAVRRLGWAAGLAGYLRAVPELEARGRVPLVDGRPESVAALAREGLARIAQARAERRRIPKAAVLTGWQAQGLLRQVAANPAIVARNEMGLSEFARRGGLVWQSMTGRF